MTDTDKPEVGKLYCYHNTKIANLFSTPQKVEDCDLSEEEKEADKMLSEYLDLEDLEEDYGPPALALQSRILNLLPCQSQTIEEANGPFYAIKYIWKLPHWLLAEGTLRIANLTQKQWEVLDRVATETSQILRRRFDHLCRRAGHQPDYSILFYQNTDETYSLFNLKHQGFEHYGIPEKESDLEMFDKNILEKNQMLEWGKK
jgi:hypothetical protein